MTLHRPVGPSLEWKLPLLISALVLSVVVAYGWVTYQEVRRSTIVASTEELRTAAAQFAGFAQTSISTRFASLARLAADTAVVAALERGAPGAEAALRGATPAADSTHDAWALVRPDGTVQLTVGARWSTPDETRLRAAVRDVLRSESVRAGGFFTARGHVMSWMAAPVRSGGRVVGVLAERRRLAHSALTARRIRGLTGQDVALYFTSVGSMTWAGLDGRPVQPAFALTRLGPTFSTRTRDGVLVYGAQAPVPGSPHLMVLTSPAVAIVKPMHGFLPRTLATGLVVLLVGAAGAWVLSRHVTRPLRLITDAADAVAGGDYAQRVSVQRTDELGRLGQTFNAMAERIGVSHAELARRVQHSTALAAELERRNEALRAAQEETLRAVGRTQRLQSVTAALAGALEFDRVVAVILRDGVEASGAAAGDIFIADADRTVLSAVRADAAAPGGARTLPVGAAAPVARAARSGEAVYVRAAEERGARSGAAADARPAEDGARAALPLVARGRTIGALHLRYPFDLEFDAETRAFLLALAQQCAQALDRALLYDAAVQARYAAEDARHAAQAANQAKSAFLAMMSHELRTPLNAIGGYVQLMELEIRGPITEAQREDLVRVRRSQLHLLSIIDDILNLARIEAGQMVVRSEDVRLDDVLAEIEPLVAPQVAARALRYDVRGGGEGVVVRGDPERLKQVLLNLLSNAVRFTDVGGSVGVECGAAGDAAFVRVTDSGMGIPADKLQAIFEPFVQVDSGLTRRTGGTGLGLAISRDLAAAMGGRIEVESEVGRGSAFTVRLPLAAGVPAAAAA